MMDRRLHSLSSGINIWTYKPSDIPTRQLGWEDRCHPEVQYPTIVSSSTCKVVDTKNTIGRFPYFVNYRWKSSWFKNPCPCRSFSSQHLLQTGAHARFAELHLCGRGLGLAGSSSPPSYEGLLKYYDSSLADSPERTLEANDAVSAL